MPTYPFLAGLQLTVQVVQGLHSGLFSPLTMKEAPVLFLPNSALICDYTNVDRANSGLFILLVLPGRKYLWWSASGWAGLLLILPRVC